MFTGILNAEHFSVVLEKGLLPFIREKFPYRHCLQRDNDPKHASALIESFFDENEVNWWPTPPESLDLNPIENVWGSLKQYLRDTCKPKSLDELKSGIVQFWATITPEVCSKYIDISKKQFLKLLRKVVVLVDTD